MKNVLFILLFLLFISCSKEDDEKCCWTFKIRVATYTYKGQTEKMNATFLDKKICDLTESEANEKKKEIYNVSNGSQGGYRVKIVTEVISMWKSR